MKIKAQMNSSKITFRSYLGRIAKPISDYMARTRLKTNRLRNKTSLGRKGLNCP